MLPARPAANPLLHSPPGRALSFPADVQDEPDDQEGEEGKGEGEDAEEEVGHLRQPVHYVGALLLHRCYRVVPDHVTSHAEVAVEEGEKMKRTETSV